MFRRNLLLALGVIALLVGLVLLALALTHSTGAKVETTEASKVKPAILVAAHPLTAGSLLRPEDMAWKELPPPEMAGDNIARGGPVAETDLVGGVTRRDFGDQEALNANAIVLARDRGFLSATLSPGYRAISLAVDVAQGVSGLIVPGDHVDIILTQTLSSPQGGAAHQVVGETILYDRRVIAVDGTLPALSKSAAPEQRLDTRGASDARTVTLEVTEHEAEQILVATQIGKVALSVRALEKSRADILLDPEKENLPVWASDVSPALQSLAQTPPMPAAFAGNRQKGSVQIEIIRGDKTELR